MPWLIERWFSGPFWVRGVSLLVFAGLVIFAARLFLSQPQLLLQQQLQRENQQATRLVNGLQRKIQQLEIPAQTASPPLPPPFSMSKFVGQADGQLLKWQPEDKQGTLEMLLPWEKLPGLFTRLARYRVVTSSTFTISVQGELLKLVLAMEFDDEP